MKTFNVWLIVCAIFFDANSAISQDAQPLPPGINLNTENDEGHKNCSKLPQYGEGNALANYLSDAIVYPAEAKERKESGTVYVGFVVNPDGHISDVKIMRSVSPSLDQTASDVVTRMGQWTPGEDDGIKERCFMTLPIKFALN